MGDGPEAVAGTTCTMQYVGVAWSDNKQFDASWDRGQPFTFGLGQGQVIPGWGQGVAGTAGAGDLLAGDDGEQVIRALAIPPRVVLQAEQPDLAGTARAPERCRPAPIGRRAA